MDTKKRYEDLLANMNQYNAGDIGITRIAYTNEEQACTYAFMRMCMSEKMAVRLDSCGNLIARRKGRNNDLPPVVIGSHLDTVYQGGKYDGVVGVTAGLEIIRRLNDKGIETEHPIEVIAFACEESSRFGVSTFGSKAMAGKVDVETYRHLEDRDGITMEKALEMCALDFNSMEDASRVDEGFHAYFELHVEQGPVLINKQKKIGIVTGIAAPARLLVTIRGKASHSGTTPMYMRKDALLGAAEISLELEKAANQEQAYGTVATVGVLHIPAGAMNVVPGQADLKIDIRSTSADSRQRVLDHVLKVIERVGETRQLEMETKLISNEDPVILSSELVKQSEAICTERGLSYEIMHSGAGHDAMNMVHLGPVGLIFVPSEDGLSHHPDEYTELDDIMHGIDVLEAAVLRQALVLKSV
ncbi:M20 family metallo-hydrolase [Ornithinibacillus gellani]|uniref:M20 family metallo-hydrolase n=1 Tax=Ornithinibacillus gellani TaxID=2293253 RepID=UPI000F465F6F|nr:M20 family metallo-hydrolase [Ornithinibacillus gellani]TQS75327.1 M20 family metallo-hydrolase [Ornithinibacillus gellani]